MSWPYLVRLETGEHVANNPADVLAKRVVASNLDHLANSHGQALVNWSAADGNGVERTSEVGAALWQSDRFALRVRPDGSHYPLRVRIRARRVDAGDPVEVSVELKARGFFLESGSTVLSVGSTSTWQTSTISMPSADTRSLVSNINGPLTLGGAPISHPEAMMSIFVGFYFDGAATVELTGLHVSEFIGA